MNSLLILVLYTIYLGVGSVFGLSPVCREEHRLRSDLQFKYAYKESLPTSIDIDFSQRSGESIYCTGTSVVASGVTKTMTCESVTRSEGPGMDRFGWAKQLAVSTKGSVKIYSGDLNASPTEFTTGTECGSSIKMALGGHYMAAVCKKAIRVYRFDGTTWYDHDEVAFANAADHELQVDLNHEDYMIVSEPSSSTVKIYKLGAITTEVQSFSGDGKVAAAVNCRGSVFAYESGGAVKIKQLSQKDSTWSDLTDIAVDPVSLSMSNDVLAVGMSNAVNVYMFANSGTEYAEYKVLKGTQSFGKLVSIEHDDLAVLDDNRAYLFHDGASTKCRALQRLDNGVCIDCGAGHSNAHDNTDSTCLSIQCTSSQYALGGECKACPVGSTGVAGPASVDSECTCAAGKSFNATAGTCDAILCASDERVVSNACEACPAGTTNAVGDDASGADTNCDATLCGANEHVVSNVCTPCVEGSTNAAGDDASGADTACDITHQCLVNQFYDTANHCQACPAGTNKAVAVDSTGGNSTCDDVVCLADHSVQIGYNSDNTKKYGSTSCSDISDCRSKCTADSGCAGYTDDGFSTVKAWGDSNKGGTDPGVINNLISISSTREAFAALKSDGSITAWGSSTSGGSGAPTGTGYTSIFSTSFAFAAMKSDGSITVWGDSAKGGSGAPTGTGYVNIVSTQRTFAALKSDGSITVWGDSSYGGTDPSISSGAASIYSTTGAFVAVGPESLAYGSVVTGTGNSFTKNKECTACHPNATRPAGDIAKGPTTQCSCKPNFEGDGSTCTACGANQESAGGDDKCKCSAGSEGDGSACQTCPANSNAVAGPIKDQCVKNEGAIWHDEVVNGAADAGACTASLDCTSKAGDPSTCIQPYEDGGVLQATSPCCKIEKPQKCGCDENHRVSSNACVACPTGEVRPAGDDPDNGDTYCNTEGITLAFTHNGNSDFVYNGQNDPDIALKAGQKYTFMRDSAGHPLRIVSEADCAGKGCDTGKWTSLPTSSLTSVDSVQGTSNAVYTFKKAGTYYYLCTAHPDMVGKITVTWDACTLSTYGSVSLSSSCEIQTSVSLTGAMTINVASLRSSGEKLMLSMSDSMSPAINAGVYALTINGFEITDIKSDNKMVESTTGTIKLSGVDLKDNPRSTGSGSLFKTTGGHIVGESLVIDNSKGEVFEGASGGDISLADSIISNSATIIKQNGGAVVVRSVNVTGGKLADMNDATSVFEAVFTDGGDGIVAVRSAVQVERSGFKNHANAPIQFDSRSCTKCKRELVVSETFFDDAKAVNAQTDAGNKPRVKIIESDFTSSGSVVSDNGIELYVIDEIAGKEMTTTETKTETCLPHQCSHKPLATSCKVSSGKGTQCICDVGVATYKAEEKTLEKQTTVEEILSMLFATADTADRVVKLVDQNVRYIPTQATPEAAKSNILLLKPTNTDGEFQSEKTILLKPDSGSVCATFQTWLCAELTACHYANGTITADCDGNKILTGASNAARRFRLRAPHPEDPNCNGAISNLKQQCTDGSGGFYSRCVQYAQFHHDKCVCMDGMKPNSNGDACISEDNLCKVNERVLNKRCVPCEGLLTNKAGDDLTGSDTTCDDVICREGFHSDGNGKCTICPAGSFNLNGDIAYDASTSTNGPATSCCASGQYEFDVDLTAGTRTCKACDDATDSLRNRFGANGAGLHCCRGTRLSSDDALKCDRILDYYKKVCQPLETNANTCKTY